MRAAVLFATVGSALSFWVGMNFLGLSSEDVLQCLVVANLAALVSLLVTLRAEAHPVIKKRILNSGVKTWALISALYLSMMVGFAPAYRNWVQALGLFLPNLIGTGYAVLIFGPIQDRFVRAGQRRARAAK